MPFLTEIAKSGIIFSQARSNSTFTTPSHMTMLTGVLPTTHGVHTPIGSVRIEEERLRLLPESIPTIAELLSRRGYYTHRFVHSRDFFLDPDLGFGRGFERRSPYGMDSFRTVRALLDDIKQTQRPLFLFIHSKRPHLPFTLPEPYDTLFTRKDYKGPIIGNQKAFDRTLKQNSAYQKLFGAIPSIMPEQEAFYDWTFRSKKSQHMLREDLEHVKALYDGALRLTDDLLRKTVEGLQSKGLWEDALVVITSDHGEELGEHGHLSHLYPWETVLRVPLVIKLPKGQGAGQVVDVPVQSADIVPTIMELLGFSAAAKFDGLPLLDAKTAKPKKLPERPHTSITEIDFYPAANAVIFGNMKLIDSYLKRELMIFDLIKDPQERKDLAATQPDRVRALLELLPAGASRSKSP